jgi:hypothetical protein
MTNYQQKRDKIILELAHKVSLIPRGQTTSADTFMEALQAIDRLVQETCKDVIGEDIEFQWLTTQHRPACSACGDMKDDPECPHSCEVTNARNVEQRQRLQALMEDGDQSHGR